MKIPYLALLLSLMPLSALAQSTLSQNQDGFNGDTMDGFLDRSAMKDSTVVERETSKAYTQFMLDPIKGTKVAVSPDTLQRAFQYRHLTEGAEGTYSHLANLGSPRLNRIFLERKPQKDFMFDTPLDFFIKEPFEFRYTNTLTPHLNLSYLKSGNKVNGTDHLDGYFAANFNKRSGFGIDMNFMFGRGRYASQATKLFDTRFYTYHHGDKYSLTAHVNLDKIKITENGGIEDVRYVTNPESMAEGKKEFNPEDMPVNLTDNWNNVQRSQFLFSHNYVFDKKIEHTDSVRDTVVTYYTLKPAYRVAHSLEFGTLMRRYIYHYTPQNYFAHSYLNDVDMDSTKQVYVNNTLSLQLIEGYSKWAVAGLTLYGRHEYSRFLLPDVAPDGRLFRHAYYENDFYVGGLLEREGGEHLSFRANAESIILGKHAGDFSLKGNVEFGYNLLGKDARIGVDGEIRNESPLFYQNTYHAAHNWWDNNFERQFALKLGGYVNVERTRTQLLVKFANLNNYIYLTDNGAPQEGPQGEAGYVSHNYQFQQRSSGLQVFQATLKQDFKLGILHWDNSLTYQKSSKNTVLPLPDLNVFSDLYIKFLYARRLDIEFGGSLTWFTGYTAPTYAPSLLQYTIQNPQTEQKVGNYPLVNAYVNCSLRGVRFYLMYYHVTQGMIDNMNSFFVPSYPVNPRMLEFGINWTFFD